MSGLEENSMGLSLSEVASLEKAVPGKHTHNSTVCKWTPPVNITEGRSKKLLCLDRTLRAGETGKSLGGVCIPKTGVELFYPKVGCSQHLQASLQLPNMSHLRAYSKKTLRE